ncbi:MAG: hypothetical protein B6D77_12215 [gamma proteobacterium symbiont of Ctena orbiculata]|nr:MAG: hypothetical protein B6D77_12215 [gamma proteobacterium symbiont of Ctena orbiculata]PVV18322.1 MAG: hypothetical protein B6D78_16600 [gamma proteobacterium symbiont of Ctena orbiculata]
MSGMLQSITLQPKPSRHLHAWRMTIHLLALFTTLLAPLILWQKLLLLSALALHGYFSLQQGRRGRGKAIMKVTVAAGGRVRLIMDDGRKQMARIRKDSLVTPWLVVMRFDLDRGWLPISLVLTAETISEEQMRQLRVLLRFSEIRHIDPSVNR